MPGPRNAAVNVGCVHSREFPDTAQRLSGIGRKRPRVACALIGIGHIPNPSMNRGREVAVDNGRRDKTPTWVKWGGAALAALVVVGFAISMFGENHGPWRHFGGGAAPVDEIAP